MKRYLLLHCIGILFFIGFLAGFVSVPFDQSDKTVSVSADPYTVESVGSHSWSEQIQLYLVTRTFNSCHIVAKQERLVCVNKGLMKIAAQYGARIGLNAAVWITRKYPELLVYSHDLAHTVGYNSLHFPFAKKTRDVALIDAMGKALVECTNWGVMGCMHGVIEAAVNGLPKEKRTDIVRRACMENPQIGKNQVYRNHCLHWAGHGMAIFTDQTLLQSLAVCEGLDTDIESENVQLCISGIFHSATLTGDTHKDYEKNIDRVYSPRDVYFPCQDIPERFRRQCYGGVPGRSRTKDLKRIFANCLAIPEQDPVKKADYIHGCYDAAANYLSVQTTQEPRAIVSACQSIADPLYVGYCYAGALRYSFLRNPSTHNPIAGRMCRLVESQQKNLCYIALGAVIRESFYSESTTQKYCHALAENSYYTTCITSQSY